MSIRYDLSRLLLFPLLSNLEELEEFREAGKGPVKTKAEKPTSFPALPFPQAQSRAELSFTEAWSFRYFIGVASLITEMKVLWEIKVLRGILIFFFLRVTKKVMIFHKISSKV